MKHSWHLILLTPILHIILSDYLFNRDQGNSLGAHNIQFKTNEKMELPSDYFKVWFFQRKIA